MKRLLMGGAALLLLPASAFGNCPGITVADMGGIAPGAFPEQYDLTEFQTAANCTMEFSENPAIAKLNAQIKGNPAELAPVAERLGCTDELADVGRILEVGASYERQRRVADGGRNLWAVTDQLARELSSGEPDRPERAS